MVGGSGIEGGSLPSLSSGLSYCDRLGDGQLLLVCLRLEG